MGWLFCLAVWAFEMGSAVAVTTSNKDEEAWVEATLSQLTLRQKIGQLIMVPVFAQADTADVRVLHFLRDMEVGGLIWMKGNSGNLRKLLPQYQTAAALPLWSSMDAEWGAAMRMEDCSRFPYASTLGACGDTLLVEQIARGMGQELKDLGMQISFGPVADVNSNPYNPVIGFRSFGNDALSVAAMARAYSRGLEQSGIMACVKHYPGHGDTETDSHHDLPFVNKSEAELEAMEWSVFKALLDVPSIMSAHLVVNVLDSGLGLPASLNPAALEGMLRRRWGYQGIIFSDALNMKGASMCYPPGELEWRALKAGNDVLLYVVHVQEAILRIEKALQGGEWTEEELNQRVRRVLKAKARYGKPHASPLQDRSFRSAIFQCYRKAVMLWKNDSLPIQIIPEANQLYLALGGDQPRLAYNRFGLFAQADFEHIPWKKKDGEALAKSALELDAVLQKYKECVVAWHIPSQRYAVGLGMDSASLARWIPVLERFRQSGGRLIHLIYGNPMAISRIRTMEKPLAMGMAGDAVLCAQEDHPMAWDAAVQALFGSIALEGIENVDINAKQPSGKGMADSKRSGLNTDLKSSTISMRWQPLLVPGYDSDTTGLSDGVLHKADSMVEAVRATGAFPGAQLVVAQGQKILYAKSYGYTDTSYSTLVDMGTLYDLASLTKVLSTGLAAMDWYRARPFSLRQKLHTLLPELKSHPLGQRSLAALMTHQAGLAAHFALDQKLVTDSEWAFQWERLKDNPSGWRQNLLQKTLRLPLGPEGNYLYSDLGLLWVERWMQQEAQNRGLGDYREYLQEHWYAPCGASRLGYRPMDKFPLARIAPTALDTIWRKKLIHGEVHDPMAYTMGGIAPHAGLFGTASDVARVLMPLVTGYFPGSAKVDASTLALFTSSYFPGNRRGLLWDRPIPGSSQARAMHSFGHSGFTGTYCWVDPSSGLIMVFLSNRIHPHTEPNLLAKSNLRTDLWDLFYSSLPSKP
jgi:beta-glucosidase-like glycosyl hydrolase/CubicO group peptidase (beta-lactamase class C family)